MVLRVLKLPTACLGGLRGARAGPREGVTLMSDNVRYVMDDGLVARAALTCEAALSLGSRAVPAGATGGNARWWYASRGMQAMGPTAGLAGRRSARAPRLYLRLRRRCRAAGAPGGDGGARQAGGGSGDDEERELTAEQWDRALQEASALLKQATRMAEEQTRAELSAALLTESADAELGAIGLDSGGGVVGGGGGALDGGGNMVGDDSGGKGDGEGNVETAARRVVALSACLVGLGADVPRAERLAGALVRAGSPYAHAELLEAKVQRLQRALGLPEIDVLQMSLSDERVLRSDVGLAVRRLLEMLDCWTPERAAVALGECPRLLYVDGFAALYEEAVEALAGLVGASAEDAAFCLSEEPSLLFALPRYRDQLPWRCRDIAELPMEVQNQISFGMRSKWTL